MSLPDTNVSESMVTRENLTAVILSGGQGSRLGGIDKGLMTVNGIAVVRRLQKLFEPLCKEVMISANRHLQTYRLSGCQIITDEYRDYQGPVSGIAAIAPHIQTPYLLVCPCDLAGMVPAVYRKLISVYDGETAVMASTEKILQPLVFIASREDALSAAGWFEKGIRSARGWHEKLGTRSSDLGAYSHAFENINTAEKLKLLPLQQHLK
ncbi:MAG: molybdenum cofactor guanylyltransferase [Pseudomonadales bacterium]|nr:molybdenum cofactor guanylyltransferase [Pseudomonadales bacterium]